MIEAVTTLQQTAPVVRVAAEQASTAEAFAANPDRVQKAPIRAPYISPVVYVDVNFDRAVLQIRDSETGDVVNQFPSEGRLEAQSREISRRAATDQAIQAPVAQKAPQQAQAATTFVQSPSPAPQQAAPAPTTGGTSSATPAQIAAFDTAARSGSSSSGSVSVLA